MTYYTFYDKKSDSLLFAGTAYDLVRRKFFPSVNALQSTVSKVKSGKNKRYSVVVDKGGDDYAE